MAKNDRSGRAIRKTGSYRHPSASALVRPDIGTQAQFRKKKPAARHRYDSSLSPALNWDGQNPAREEGEALIRQILEAQDLAGAKAAAEKLRAYEHPNGWVNRMILGNSLCVMNSLLHYESLGGQVQMIYMDPPYGVKFGSNFQPFVGGQAPRRDRVAAAIGEPVCGKT